MGPQATLDDQSRLFEDGEVLGDGRPRDLELSGDLAGGQLLIADEAEDLPSVGLGDRAQCCFHGSI